MARVLSGASASSPHSSSNVMFAGMVLSVYQGEMTFFSLTYFT